MKDWRREYPARYSEFRVDMALLDLGTIPEHLREPYSIKDELGHGGFYLPAMSGDMTVMCERRGCPNGFSLPHGREMTPQQIGEELNRMGYVVNSHYTEESARPYKVEMLCPEHAG